MKQVCLLLALGLVAIHAYPNLGLGGGSEGEGKLHGVLGSTKKVIGDVSGSHSGGVGGVDDKIKALKGAVGGLFGLNLDVIKGIFGKNIKKLGSASDISKVIKEKIAKDIDVLEEIFVGIKPGNLKDKCGKIVDSFKDKLEKVESNNLAVVLKEIELEVSKAILSKLAENVDNKPKLIISVLDDLKKKLENFVEKLKSDKLIDSGSELKSQFGKIIEKVKSEIVEKLEDYKDILKDCQENIIITINDKLDSSGRADAKDKIDDIVDDCKKKIEVIKNESEKKSDTAKSDEQSKPNESSDNKSNDNNKEEGKSEEDITDKSKEDVEVKSEEDNKVKNEEDDEKSAEKEKEKDEEKSAEEEKEEDEDKKNEEKNNY